MGSELVPKLVAVEAGRNDIGPVATAVLLGHQVLTRGLEARRLGQGETVDRGEACSVCQPHGEIAVVAPAGLAVEGGIAGGGIALGHVRVL
ncbi:MAG: hypothetical protein ACRER5_08300 [Pseudomonas sp.]